MTDQKATDPNYIPPDEITSDEDIWFEPRNLCNLIVRVPILSPQDGKQSILIFHCHLSVMVVSCGWFKNVYEADNTVTEITMPESFTHSPRLWDDFKFIRANTQIEDKSYGRMICLPDKIRLFFGLIHYSIPRKSIEPMGSDTWQIIQMAFYAESLSLIDLCEESLITNMENKDPSAYWCLDDYIWSKHYHLETYNMRIWKKILTRQPASINRLTKHDNPWNKLFTTHVEPEKLVELLGKLTQ